MNSFNVDGGAITQWFAPTDKGEDLDYARQLINGAQQGILFLFFNPGAFESEDKPARWTLLQNVLARHQQGAPNYDPALYIHGVVNQELVGLTTESSAKPSKHAALDPTNASPVKLYGNGSAAPLSVPYESMVPKAIKDAFHAWGSEVMNQGVHVHSKVGVIDPFGKKPVVITGSHNLGYKASTKNDDNMMIVEDNAPLAAAYAVNIIAIYQSYRWNTYVDAHAKDPQVWHGPQDNATWQESYLKTDGAELAEIKFWLGESASAPAAAGQPAPGGQAGARRDRNRAVAARGRSQAARTRRSEEGCADEESAREVTARPGKKGVCEEGARAKEWGSTGESETARRQARAKGSVADLVTVAPTSALAAAWSVVLGVAPSTLHYWLNDGIIPGEQLPVHFAAADSDDQRIHRIMGAGIHN